MITTIKRSKVAIFSDLHLGIHTNSAEWHAHAMKWAKWFVADLKKRKIRDVIFCGDWHHSRSEISVDTLQISADIMHLFSDFNLIAIVGNHDIYYKHRTDINSMAVFKNSKNVTVLSRAETVEAFDRVITFCPWNTDISSIPKSDIIFGHLEMETFQMNTYKTCSEGYKIKDLTDKGSLIISGHFHTRQERSFRDKTILYVGNPFQMDFGDTGNTKGYYLLDIESLNYEFIENEVSPTYQKLLLSELTRAGSFTNTIRSIVTNNIVKLKIDKNITQGDTDILVSKLGLLHPAELTVDYDINFDMLLDSEKDKEDFSGVDIPQAIREFVNLLDIEDKEPVINYTIDLYEKCRV
tara:strand:+ start:2512 stop:3567 length:1056 start_codon:yes stop_codon:yes gene_type:complete